MKLTDEQRTWFDSVRRQWFERIAPNAGLHGAHVLDVPARLPQAAMSRARVFADRMAALPTLPANAVVAEIGTETGWFAEQVLAALDPRELHLFDLEFDTLRGARPALADHPRVRLHQGDSPGELAKLPDRYFDWIYIDGDHTLEGVRRDAEVAVAKVKSDGILVFNDYTVWSILELTDYGVVPIVNELLASGEWEMVHIALHPLMYCDVAIRRARSPAGRIARYRRTLMDILRARLRRPT